MQKLNKIWENKDENKYYNKGIKMNQEKVQNCNYLQEVREKQIHPNITDN